MKWNLLGFLIGALLVLVCIKTTEAGDLFFYMEFKTAPNGITYVTKQPEMMPRGDCLARSAEFNAHNDKGTFYYDTAISACIEIRQAVKQEVNN